MMASDSQAMGRVGEVLCRTWQTADKMKRQFGKLESIHTAKLIISVLVIWRSIQSTRQSAWYVDNIGSISSEK